MADILWNDAETFNGVKDIKAGTYEYARTSDIMLIAYAINNEPVQLWDRTKFPMPRQLKEITHEPTTRYIAHHAMFDRNVWRASGLFPDFASDPYNWDCTMVKAMLHGFTGSLDKLCDIFGLDSDEAKLKDGKKLINRFCKPAPKNHKADRYTAETHPEDWQRFCEYAVRDVGAMRKIAARLPSWNWCPKEYHLDQVINDRGFQVDTELVSAGVKAAAEEKINLAERFVRLTNGDVSSPTQRAKFLGYLNDQFDLGLENTQKATLEPLLKSGGLDPRAEALIEIALMANKTSTAKYAALEPAVSPDDRFRGGLQFSGAQRTRRWAGRIVQPQNFPSKDLPKSKSIDIYIDALKAGVHGTLFDGELMRYGSAALRGVLIVPEGKKLCVSDLANIEGRANAWLAGEDWKLRAFSAYDTFKLDENGQKIPDGRGDFERMGPDLYKVAAGKILGKKPNEITSDERNSFGKVTELALGYEGGVGAIQNFATAMDVAFADHWGNIEKSVSRELILQAEDNWDLWGKQKLLSIEKPKWLRAEIAKLSKPGKLPYEFSCAAEAASSYWVAFGKDEVVKEMKDEWVASEVVKLSWRDSHPAIKTLWHDCKNAAVNALDNPGQYFKAGRLRFRYVRFNNNNYLIMVLPSRKVLVYFNPRIVRHLEVSTAPNRNEVMKAVTFARKQLGARVIQKLFREIRSDITSHTQLNKRDFLPFLKSCQRELEKLGSDGSISYWGVDAVTKQWSRQHIYGGKFCISKGTEVLTDTGWLPIQDVTRKNKIWDGLEWVSCDGSIYQGNKETIEAHGVRMTPDHLVLTVEGWKHASQSERYNRAESRLPNSGKVSWQRWGKIPMASSVCLRQPSNYTSFGTEKTKEKGNNRILWMQKAFNDRKEEYNSRNVETSVICGMAFNESSMYKPQSQSMEKLWRQGHNCLRKVARFLRELSRGYAVNLPTGLNAGTSGQFEGLPFKELRLGYAEGTGEQHSEHTVHQYPKGPDVGVTGSKKIQNRSLNSCVSDREQRARKVLVRETRQKEQVYDLINCGPRNRFVVKDKNGQPLIVHNCENACQSLSRDILMQGIFSAEEAGYKPVLTVHDELVTECPDTDEFSEQGLSKILSTPLNWCPGFPLAAEGFEAYRYRK